MPRMRGWVHDGTWVARWLLTFEISERARRIGAPADPPDDPIGGNEAADGRSLSGLSEPFIGRDTNGARPDARRTIDVSTVVKYA